MFELIMFILVVDDLRLFGDTFHGMPIKYAVTSKEALDILESEFHDVAEVWLDHDLGMFGEIADEVTPVIYWLEEKGHNEQANHVYCIRVLTSNPVGAQKIAMLSRYYFIGATVTHHKLRNEEEEAAN